MEETKMKIKNEDGKYIEKNVPNDLVSNYEMIGWEIVKEEKKIIENKPLVKDDKKINE